MTTAPSPASTTMTTTAPFCQLVDVDNGQRHHCNQWHINYDDDYHDPPTQWLPRAAKALMTATTILRLPPLPPPLPRCACPPGSLGGVLGCILDACTHSDDNDPSPSCLRCLNTYPEIRQRCGSRWKAKITKNMTTKTETFMYLSWEEYTVK